jgi:hypothetical protein
MFFQINPDAAKQTPCFIQGGMFLGDFQGNIGVYAHPAWMLFYLT